MVVNEIPLPIEWKSRFKKILTTIEIDLIDYDLSIVLDNFIENLFSLKVSLFEMVNKFIKVIEH